MSTVRWWHRLAAWLYPIIADPLGTWATPAWVAEAEADIEAEWEAEFARSRARSAALVPCAHCGSTADVKPSVREQTIVNAGYAEQDVPVRQGNLCAECRKEMHAVPEEGF